MRIARSIVAVLAFAVIATGTGFLPSAQAQVAAPALMPDTFVTPNPAAMQWGMESRAGLGYGQTETDADSGDFDSEESRAGALLLWGWGGLAGELEHEETASGDLDREGDLRRGALSLMPLGWLSIGVFYQGADYSQTDAADISVDFTSEILAFGGSVRLFDLFYFGYAQGNDEVDVDISVNTTPPAGFSFSDTREVRAWGAGVRGGKDFRYHLEYYVIDFDPVTFEGNAFNPDGGEIDEHEDSAIVIELGWRGFLAGAEWIESDQKSDKRDTRTQRYSVAWVPASGFGVVYHYATEEKEDQDTGDTVEESKTHSLSLVYLF
jgi:hypothetical protein